VRICVLGRKDAACQDGGFFPCHKVLADDAADSSGMGNNVCRGLR